ncbi:unnamed protein product [Zymoseptoria tritici ST99CH_1A5]|nr:unnamed protein product [Zymoseptoria tritici ST99CH_1E4]SMR49641.1 unnamed protein product [Zymoseptoria tritici ST99CH_3D1]SMY22337.1 unnamed protein product [Zymoseptoria tritici ST99CH_1A5]
MGHMKRPHSDMSTMASTSLRISDLQLDPALWYKIRVLVYDLNNPKDKACETRMLQTTDVHHISAPYFSTEEAEKVKLALTDEGETTLETALTSALSNFFEKRKASGDFRPCGPHDMVPVYLSIFEIGKEDLKEEKFVSRVRRSGLVGKKK